MRPEGIEPPTLWSEARCSNPLSYGRVLLASLLALNVVLVGARGFEPPTSSSRTTRATKLRYAPTDPVRRREGRITDAFPLTHLRVCGRGLCLSRPVEGRGQPPARRRVGTASTPCAGRPQGSRASRRDSTAANARSDAAYAPYLLNMARFDQPPSTITSPSPTPLLNMRCAHACRSA